RLRAYQLFGEWTGIRGDGGWARRFSIDRVHTARPRAAQSAGPRRDVVGLRGAVERCCEAEALIEGSTLRAQRFGPESPARSRRLQRGHENQALSPEPQASSHKPSGPAIPVDSPQAGW